MPYILLFVPLMGLGIGAAIVINAGRAMVRGATSRNWPQTRGQVTKSRIAKCTMRGANRSVTKYSPEVIYKFSVGNQRVVGDRVRFGAANTSWDAASAVVDRYPAGTDIDIHYHPDNPTLCTLESGCPLNMVPSVLLGVFFMLLSIFIAWVFFFGRYELPATDVKRPMDRVPRNAPDDTNSIQVAPTGFRRQ